MIYADNDWIAPKSLPAQLRVGIHGSATHQQLVKIASIKEGKVYMDNYMILKVFKETAASKL